MKTLIVGWDGASWPLLDRFMAEGLLPNLAALCRSGARGDLLSTTPTATPTAWTSLVTGTNPGRHGILGFRARVPGSYTPAYVGIDRRAVAPVWQTLGARGWRVGVVNVPVTYPVSPVNGFLLAGMETPNSFSPFAWPPALKEELNSAIPGGYRIDVGIRNPKEDYLARVRDLIGRRRQALRFCLGREKPDFLMAVFVATDRLQHIFWHCLDPGAHNYDPAAAARYGPQLRECYHELDAGLGELIDRCQPDLTALVSDHGFGELRKTVQINRWLRDAGFLTLRQGAGARATLADIDWAKTRAYSFSHAGEIFINQRGREPQGIVAAGRDYAAVAAELRAGLLALRDDEDGRPLVDRVWRRDELYWGPQTPAAADMFFVMRAGGYLARDGFEGGETVFQYIAGENCSGVHRDEGVLLLTGRGIRAGAQLPATRLWDVVPTLLHAAGEALPGDCDGRVISEAFLPGTLPSWPPRYAPPLPAATAAAPTYSATEQEQLAARLRGLGYID